jgi:hypothetical protein
MLDIARIKRDYAHALRDRCSERRCTLRLDHLSDHIVLKGEEICEDRKMCDSIVFVVNSSVTIGIVELKSKTIHTSEVADKLANSSEIALDIFKKHGDRRTKSEFLHILLYKALDGSESRKLRDRKIKVEGREHDIIPERCGSSFSKIISNHLR